MTQLRDALGRFGELLDALDALEADGEAGETLDDLNAELEDALALLSALDPEDEAGEIADTLDAIRAMAGDYRATGVDGVEPLAAELEKTALSNECGGIQI